MLTLGPLTVINTGNTRLEISSIRSSNPRIRPLKNTLSINPNASEALPLAFTPLTNEIIETELILVSNDPTRDTLAIPLSGMLPSPKPEPVADSGLLIIDPTTPTIDDEISLSISGDFPASNATIAAHMYSVADEVITIDITSEWVGDAFDAEDATVTSWVVEESVGRLNAGTYQLVVKVNETEFLSSSLTVRESGAVRGLMSLDFDLTDGDQAQRIGGDAEPGRVYDLQINVKGVLVITGWSLTVEYDPSQVRYVSNSFTPSSYIPGLLPLVDEQERSVSVGGTVLGSDVTATGDGTLGVLSFEVLDGFSGSTDLVITENNFRIEGGGSEKYQVLSIVTITEESIEAPVRGDFDGSGKVDFTDFFSFADVFGGTDPTYDLDGNGAVDFDDFFIFADNFGKEVRAKLMVLAQEYLGLPASSHLEQNYPNPFNALTTLRYQLAEPALVRLDIFDLSGQKVRTLVSDDLGAGAYEVYWDGTNEQGLSVSTGIYLAKLQAGDLMDVKKMMLMK